MKTILVPVEPNPAVYPLLDVALILAETLGAYVEGRLSTFDMPAVVTEIAGTWPIPEEVLTTGQVEGARNLFTTYMSSRGLAEATDTSEGAGWRWGGDKPLRDGEVGALGRIFDAIVVGRPDPAGGYPRNLTFESALFESGRPLFVAPPIPPTTIGRTITIAWNGSTETARAVAFAMPLLAKADRVMVLTVEGATVDGPSGRQLARMLRRNGIPAEPVSREGTARSNGEIILDYAMSTNTDLLIKGAYTQSRLRQMIFGGATRHILENARLVVFMAH
ncbi:universal stress protein [Prosthecomicrobium sp. N25]|uniref:universal stress protein n=1 Tax=Prosthecomicrobium sp. N25 TaxID=3129254 RepID=UPI003076C894